MVWAINGIVTVLPTGTARTVARTKPSSTVSQKRLDEHSFEAAHIYSHGFDDRCVLVYESMGYKSTQFRFHMSAF